MSIMQSIKMLQLLDVLSLAKAQQRIPEEFQDTTFFSQFDWWMFELNRTPTTCIACEELRGSTFTGQHIRRWFPYITVLDVNTLGGAGSGGDGLVHPNCRCRFTRVLE